MCNSNLKKKITIKSEELEELIFYYIPRIQPVSFVNSDAVSTSTLVT
jgi:hypothetical protein